ncbi:hypothetical protein T11_18066 [Trichinella zimbabwensis]|uniref:Uncharacterized protein n=1 Tax=Trichinella zimbabwensis TaxID=268475 RepID=A0A0V1I2N6_9BILA|nr:hypothetical protein T11_18066 [Trichinella zimbabwensis]
MQCGVKVEAADLQGSVNAVAITSANNWEVDQVSIGFTNEQNYQDLKYDPSITMLFRESNAIRCEKWKLLICNGFYAA